MTSEVAIIGSGPAALMAADVLARHHVCVTILEKKRWPAKKLLIAGSSGLNITNNLPLEEFERHYTGSPQLWHHVLHSFTPQDWIDFIENNLGIGTFVGTSGRYFVQGLKAAKLVRSWLKRLGEMGVTFQYQRECVDFNRQTDGSILLTCGGFDPQKYQAVGFALGGGSYEPIEDPLRWPIFFQNKGLEFHEFKPSNTGYQVKWQDGFLAEADGLPIKNIELKSSRGCRKGDVVVTRYGLEGTPVYFVGETGLVTMDLKPDLTESQIISKCQQVKENLSPIRRIKKKLNLCPAALALLYHHAPSEKITKIDSIAHLVKNFPLHFTGPQPLTESISSSGGIALSQVNEFFMFKRFPGVFAAGEMLDWDAPTGGYLIQGSVSQGYLMGQGIKSYLEKRVLHE